MGVVVGEGAVMGYAVVDFGGDGDEEGSVDFDLFGGHFWDGGEDVVDQTMGVRFHSIF